MAVFFPNPYYVHKCRLVIRPKTNLRFELGEPVQGPSVENIVSVEWSLMLSIFGTGPLEYCEGRFLTRRRVSAVTTPRYGDPTSLIAILNTYMDESTHK